ncbi:alpha/beta hydrolase fold protein [Halothece sp. PCC 7418]|uniref:alpha/beta fold hydrolase n=1 Tax=Halothece sp. (strain PCC 7418) TaxID=65093 RepID=UPI0002A07A32|nr:alpha/beta hydrolase [Halothece sp. PCC 7418]AFZ45558.1 alpha/beta hydrolase fold protein [Halothece sp. PCC 7418]
MSQQALWISVSPTLKRFHRPLQTYLSRQLIVQEWAYQQEEDEPCTLDIPVTLLHDYLKCSTQPVHLVGHSTGGVVAFLYALHYPERVKSLTLLGVGVNPLIDWHAHYYTYRQLLSACSQNIVLAQMVRALFGSQDQNRTKGFVKLLAGDLQTTPSPHSLMSRSRLQAQTVSSPLFVCGSQDDVIVDPNALHGWKNYFKPEDRSWECASGHHFFHYYHPQPVGNAILNFWESLESKKRVMEETVKIDQRSQQPPSVEEGVIFDN